MVVASLSTGIDMMQVGFEGLLIRLHSGENGTSSRFIFLHRKNITTTEAQDGFERHPRWSSSHPLSYPAKPKESTHLANFGGVFAVVTKILMCLCPRWGL